jgi:chemotaxis protein CheX
MMAKETVWQRRARKRGSAKADYYPKVNLGNDDLDGLARVAALTVVEVQAQGESEEAPGEPEKAVAEAASFGLVEAEPLEAANDAGAPEAIEASGFAKPAAIEAEAVIEAVEEVAVEPVDADASLEATDEIAPEALEAEAPLEAAEEVVAEPIEAPETDPLPDGSSIRLPEFLDLAAATPLAKTLLERRGQPIVIDGSAVHQLGAQCVQVLLSAKRTWSVDGVTLSIVNCAPRMIEDLQFLGIDAATLISGDLPQ